MSGWRKRQINEETPPMYSEKWDAFYNPVTNEWTEDKCSDPNCPECTNRPERPLEENE